MNYKFVAPVHNLRISSVLKKGIKINDVLRLSNDPGFLENLMNTEDFYENIGYIHQQELSNSNLYIYAEGDLSELDDRYREENFYLAHCFWLLREVQIFLNALWFVKDHNAYIRDGFIFVTNNQKKEYCSTQKASVSQITSLSSGETGNIVFTREEIHKGLDGEEDFKTSIEIFKDSGKTPISNPYSKGFDRRSRTFSFVNMARSTSILPLKIFNYCCALECLFTNDNTEVNHKISERVAALIGDSYEEKVRIFRVIKKAYGIRSNLTHGNVIDVKHNVLSNISFELDRLVRIIFNQYSKQVIDVDNNKLNDLFLSLLFNATED